MPNFTVNANGTAKVSLQDPRVTLGDGDHSVFANGGTALVIHAAYTSESQAQRALSTGSSKGANDGQGVDEQKVRDVPSVGRRRSTW